MTNPEPAPIPVEDEIPSSALPELDALPTPFSAGRWKFDAPDGSAMRMVTAPARWAWPDRTGPGVTIRLQGIERARLAENDGVWHVVGTDVWWAVVHDSPGAIIDAERAREIATALLAAGQELHRLQAAEAHRQQPTHLRAV